MKWLHNILKGASLTTALFIFQACYGAPQNPMLGEAGEAPMSFSVFSRTSGTPLKGIHILGEAKNYTDGYQILGVTGEDGSCKVMIPYFRNVEGPFVRFEDPDGKFAAKDTVLYDLRERDIAIKLADN